ncbi:unnamed protein product [Rhodiola kirilowii]
MEASNGCWEERRLKTMTNEDAGSLIYSFSPRQATIQSVTSKKPEKKSNPFNAPYLIEV